LTVSTVSEAQLNLAWRDNANNETGFQIARCDGAACTGFTQLFTTTANVRSYANLDVIGETTYCYQVRAYRSADASAYTTPTCRTTSPLPPSNLTATTLSRSQIRLNWQDNAASESGFRVERCPVTTGNSCSNFAQIRTLAANARTFTNTGLTANTAYCYRLRRPHYGHYGCHYGCTYGCTDRCDDRSGFCARVAHGDAAPIHHSIHHSRADLASGNPTSRASHRRL
jgi:titin